MMGPLDGRWVTLEWWSDDQPVVGCYLVTRRRQAYQVVQAVPGEGAIVRLQLRAIPERDIPPDADVGGLYWEEGDEVNDTEELIAEELRIIANKQARLRRERPARDRAMAQLAATGTIRLEDLAYAAGVSRARARHIIAEVTSR